MRIPLGPSISPPHSLLKWQTICNLPLVRPFVILAPLVSFTPWA